MIMLNSSRHTTRARAGLGLAACLWLVCASAAGADPGAGPLLAFAPASDSAEAPGSKPPPASLPDAYPAQKKKKIEFYVNGFYEYQFAADMDGGGDYSVQRIGGLLNTRSELTDSLHLSINFGYELDLYNFNGVTTFETTETTILLTNPSNQNPDGTLLSTIHVQAAPWSDIQTYDLNANFILDLSNNWTLWLGPVFQLSRENGAGWSNAVVGGGVVGTTWEISDALSIGGGLGVVTQLEDDIRFFPLFLLKWQFTEHLRLDTTTPSAVGKTFAMELIWAPNPKLELAFGGGYQRRRFRLDDQGLAPDGVGEETRIPMWLRFSYNFTNRISLDLFGALSTKITLKVDDANADRVAQDDADIAPSLGARLNVSF